MQLYKGNPYMFQCLFISSIQVEKGKQIGGGKDFNILIYKYIKAK